MIRPFKSIVKLFSSSNVIEQVRYASQALPQLSSDKYNLKRKDFGVIQSSDVSFFKSILGDGRVLTEESDVLPYNIDWIKNCRGQSKVVLKPKTTYEVSKILSYCNSRQLEMIMQ